MAVVVIITGIIISDTYAGSITLILRVAVKVVMAVFLYLNSTVITN